MTHDEPWTIEQLLQEAAKHTDHRIVALVGVHLRTQLRQTQALERIADTLRNIHMGIPH